MRQCERIRGGWPLVSGTPSYEGSDIVVLSEVVSGWFMDGDLAMFGYLGMLSKVNIIFFDGEGGNIMRATW